MPLTVLIYNEWRKGSGIRYGWLTPPSFSSNFPRPYLSRRAQADAALKNRRRQFGIDGEAVILGAEGKSNFHVLHSGKHGSEVRLCAFTAGDRITHPSVPLTSSERADTNLGRALIFSGKAMSLGLSNSSGGGQ